MSDCGVCLGEWDGDSPEFFDVRTPKARKPHSCSECGKVIAKGDVYQRTCGKNDGDFWTYDTCLICAEIRAAFSCNGESLGGMMWEDFRDYVFPEMTTTCFDRLKTPEAKAELRRRWMEWKGLR